MRDLSALYKETTLHIYIVYHAIAMTLTVSTMRSDKYAQNISAFLNIPFSKKSSD